jgi:hypothetical protein
MTYHYTPASVFGTDPQNVRNFLDEYGGALAEAAHRLGGRSASARVFLLCEAVQSTVRLTNTQRRQLVDFHQLLILENVGDPDRIESALFAEINPGSPFVEECCLLAEMLEVLLRKISKGDLEENQRLPGSGLFQEVA